MDKLIELSQSEWLYKHERDFLLRNLNYKNKRDKMIDYYQNLVTLRQSGLASKLRSEQVLEELASEYPCIF